MSVASQAISSRTGKSTASMASSMNSRGIDIQEALIMPITKLLLTNIPKYATSNLFT